MNDQQIAENGGCCHEPAAADSCHAPAEAPSCHSEGSNCGPKKGRPDVLLWGSAGGIVLLYAAELLFGEQMASVPYLATMARSSFDLMNVMWWSLLAAFVFVGLLSRVPREFVIAVLGDGGGLRGILRATLAGVLLDLCSHGILMVGMKLYERGASVGQTVAFLIASPWNSLSLTLILIALVGLGWTLAFIVLSMLIAVIGGLLFNRFVRTGVLPANPNAQDLPHDFQFWREARAGLKQAKFGNGFALQVLKDGVSGSKMVLRWVLLGVLLAGAVRTFVSPENFQHWFGASLGGLGLTMVAATIIEICSEGSTPIAADLLNRAGAPGNGFAFLMTGVSTDYTEIMSLRDTTGSWKIALFLPLVTVPQVLVIGWLMNQFGG